MSSSKLNELLAKKETGREESRVRRKTLESKSIKVKYFCSNKIRKWKDCPTGKLNEKLFHTESSIRLENSIEWKTA